MTEKKCDGCGITFLVEVLTISNGQWFCWGCLGEYEKEDE